MIDATPRHLLIWGNMSGKERTEVITKFYKTAGSDFNIMDDVIKDYILTKYNDKMNVKTKVIIK